MNANELADKLEKPMVDNPDCPNFSRTRAFMKQVITILRQQQAEIEVLKEGITKIREGCSSVKTDDVCTKEVKELATLIIRDCNMTLRRLEDD